jgi:hypothetical protein
VPLTGAPSGAGRTVRWDGQTWRQLYTYTGEITWVLGEFYWKLERGERTRNTDYASGQRRLYREETSAEVTWSIGGTLDAKTIAAAFKLPPERQAALAREASPVSGGGASVVKTMLVIALGLLLIGWLMHACSRDECDDLRQTFGESSTEYRQCRASSGSGLRSSRSSGGSFGGFSGGGGHK